MFYNLIFSMAECRLIVRNTHTPLSLQIMKTTILQTMQPHWKHWGQYRARVGSQGNWELQPLLLFCCKVSASWKFFPSPPVLTNAQRRDSAWGILRRWLCQQGQTHWSQTETFQVWSLQGILPNFWIWGLATTGSWTIHGILLEILLEGFQYRGANLEAIFSSAEKSTQARMLVWACYSCHCCAAATIANKASLGSCWQGRGPMLNVPWVGRVPL